MQLILQSQLERSRCLKQILLRKRTLQLYRQTLGQLHLLTLELTHLTKQQRQRCERQSQVLRTLDQGLRFSGVNTRSTLCYFQLVSRKFAKITKNQLGEFPHVLRGLVAGFMMGVRYPETVTFQVELREITEFYQGSKEALEWTPFLRLVTSMVAIHRKIFQMALQLLRPQHSPLQLSQTLVIQRKHPIRKTRHMRHVSTPNFQFFNKTQVPQAPTPTTPSTPTPQTTSRLKHSSTTTTAAQSRSKSKQLASNSPKLSMVKTENSSSEDRLRHLSAIQDLDLGKYEVACRLVRKSRDFADRLMVDLRKRNWRVQKGQNRVQTQPDNI